MKKKLLFIGGVCHGERKDVLDGFQYVTGSKISGKADFSNAIVVRDEYRREMIRGENQTFEVMLVVGWTADQMLATLIDGFRM